MKRVCLVLLGVACAHNAYYLWPVGPDRLWAKYVGDGFGFALVCLAVASIRASGEVGALLATIVSLWGALEGAQQGVCGLASWGTESAEVDLCLARAGPWPYVLVAGISTAWLLTRRGQNG